MRPRHVVTKEEIETLNTALMMKKYRGKTLAYADINTFLSSFYQNNALKFEIFLFDVVIWNIVYLIIKTFENIPCKAYSLYHKLFFD